MARPRKPRLSTSDIETDLKYMRHTIKAVCDSIYFHRQEKESLGDVMSMLAQLDEEIRSSIIVCDSR